MLAGWVTMSQDFTRWSPPAISRCDGITRTFGLMDSGISGLTIEMSGHHPSLSEESS